jgi:hypothetical protein
MAKIDFSYEVSDERLRAYRRLSILDRLRWLEDICRFTAMVRRASTRDYSQQPGVQSPQSSRYAADK